MIDMGDMEHANATNPCQGICVQDDNDLCIGCLRTSEEKNKWYAETIQWREQVLVELRLREEKLF
jgi:predicted Fe-S protein YdhL (DUF1289 family)